MIKKVIKFNQHYKKIYKKLHLNKILIIIQIYNNNNNHKIKLINNNNNKLANKIQKII